MSIWKIKILNIHQRKYIFSTFVKLRDEKQLVIAVSRSQTANFFCEEPGGVCFRQITLSFSSIFFLAIFPSFLPLKNVKTLWSFQALQNRMWIRFVSIQKGQHNYHLFVIHNLILTLICQSGLILAVSFDERQSIRQARRADGSLRSPGWSSLLGSLSGLPHSRSTGAFHLRKDTIIWEGSWAILIQHLLVKSDGHIYCVSSPLKDPVNFVRKWITNIYGDFIIWQKHVDWLSHHSEPWNMLKICLLSQSVTVHPLNNLRLPSPLWNALLITKWI